MDELLANIMEIENKEELIDEMMKKYGQDILQLVFSYVNNKELAEDLTQDIFIKTYRSLHTYKGKSKVRTWLWRIAINHCKDYLKSWYNQNVFPSSSEVEIAKSHNESVEQTVIQQDEDEMLAAIVLGLPIKYREVIYLYYFEELPIKEIAMLLQINENTVKTRLKRAKELLKDRLEER